MKNGWQAMKWRMPRAGGKEVMKNEEMARLFSEATHPESIHGKTMVVKYGGNAMINEELKNAVMNDLVTLTLLGVRVVLVHGGGPAINEMLKKWVWKAISQTVCG